MSDKIKCPCCGSGKAVNRYCTIKPNKKVCLDCLAQWDQSRRAAPEVPEVPEEIEAWKASAEVFARWWNNIEVERAMSDEPPYTDDDEIIASSIEGQNQTMLTAGHIREVIKLCRTK